MGARRTPADREDRLRADRRRVQALQERNGAVVAGWVPPRRRHCWVRKSGPRGDEALAGIVLGWRRTPATTDGRGGGDWMALVAVAGESHLLQVVEVPVSDIRAAMTY